MTGRRRHQRRLSPRRRAGELLLTLGASLGVASVLLAASAMFFGVQPLIFRSGSMSPTISTGSLALAREVPADEIRVGDVVSVPGPDGRRVTHRVEKVSSTPSIPGSFSLVLRGDANPVPDRDPYLVTSADRVFLHVPVLGYLAAWLAGPLGMFLAGLAVAAVIASAVVRPGRRPDPGGRRKATAASAAILALAAAGPVAMSASSEGTLAAFSDAATILQDDATHVVLQPTTLDCQTGLLGLLSMTISTTSTDARYEYVARVYTAASGGSQLGSEAVMSDVSGSTRSHTYTSANFDLGLLNLGTTYYARVYAHVPGTSWYSADYQVRSFTVTGVLVPLAFNCGAASGSPSITFMQPASGVTRTTIQMQDDVTAACGAAWAGCVTATDNGTVSTVQYVLKRVGNVTGTKCWDGSTSWVADCSLRSATSAGGGVWKIPKLTLITYPYISDGDFSLTIRATDNLGNVTTAVAAFVVTY